MGTVNPTYRISTILLLLVAFVFNTTSPVEAATGIPKILNRQGRLFDSNGALLGGAGTDYCFRFSIYDDAIVGGAENKLWPATTSSIMTVRVRNGVFNAGVGDTNAGGDLLDFDFESNDNAYLDVQAATRVGATCAAGDGVEVFEALSPRQRIVASGYAINAGTLRGFAPAQNATGSSIPVLNSGNLTLGGTNPQINATSTNALVLQGGTGTGSIQFFNATNFLSSTGTLSIAGNLNIGGSSALQNMTFANATGTSISATSGIFTNASATGLTFGNATGSTVSVTTSSATSFLGTNVSSTEITFTNATGTNLSANTGIFTNASATGITFTNATGTNFFATTGIFTNGSTTGLTFTNATGSTLSLLNGLGTLRAINVSSTGVTFTNATSSGNLTVNSLILSSLSPGSLLFMATSSIVSQNNNNLYWNQTSTSLSVGTSTAIGRLTVQGTNTSTANFALSILNGTAEPLLQVRNDATITLGRSAASSTINIGTGTGVDSINIGTGSTAADNIIFGNSSVATIFSAFSGATSTTPFLFQANSYTTGTAAFLLNATSLTNGTAFAINGTASNRLLTVARNSSGALDFARVTVGGTSTLDQFYVYGRINSSWNYNGYDCLARDVNAATRPVATDSSYGGFYFDEDAGGSGTMDTIATVSSTSGICRLDNQTTPAAGEGEWWGSGGINVTERSLNPVAESRLRSTLNTDHRTVFGLMGVAVNGDPGVDPTNGVYFRKTFASTTWGLVTRTGGTECLIPTAITTEAFNTLRIEIDNAAPAARFYINGTLTGTHTAANGACFPTSTTQWGFYIGNEINGTTNRATDIDYLRVWSDDPPVKGMSESTGSATAEYSYDPIHGADIAEAYLSDEIDSLTPGTLVAINRLGDYKLRTTKTEYDADTFSVITTSPGLVLGGESGNVVSVAITGRVPVKVNLENGPIHPGDWVAASPTEGQGMKATRPGMVIGRALESFNGEAEISQILVSIEPQFWNGGEEIFSSVATSTLDILQAETNLLSRATQTVKNWVQFSVRKITAWSAVIQELFSRNITLLPQGDITLPAGENQIAGKNTLVSGASEVFVPHAKIQANTKIFITPTVSTNIPIAVTEKRDGQGFVVGIKEPAPYNIPFDWIIFQAYDAAPETVGTQTFSQTTTTNQPITDTPSPEATTSTAPTEGEPPTIETPPTEL